ncbi:MULTISPECIES: hypothetical protein [Vibrio]|uniref:hypothetical protein n=1 Tax=Vibrio TaxID=662 RepID=UPI002074F1AF|nr:MULTISPECIES: hypothetical protein [Vibrio]USD32595.1 hypothetical protein J8Z27_00185 [Vibrio sp. SCSIO 43186]USD45636.1 hypothetical protein J4N38_00185 [Vibrio sp. SCSIO 43145]USD69720.1 hypothetical protein J4N41_00185 [Vibrio sp. SCSIO 43139]USD94627.1 hypothetical protein CTT30_00190 [Vibrio coralliilyticus]
MTKEELYLIAKLTRANTASRAFLAAEDVLLHGLTQTDARHKHDVSKSTVSDAVKRYSETYSEICSVYKLGNSLDSTPLEAYYHDDRTKHRREYMLKDIFYVHPNSNRVTSEKYGVVSHKGIAYIAIMGNKMCSLWNSDEARDLLLNEVIRRDLSLVTLSKVQLLVSLGELTQKRTLQFDLFWQEKSKRIVRTDFEQRITPSQELLDVVAKEFEA